MGIIAMLLFSTGHLGHSFHVPFWVIISCYLAISLGTLTGGWKVIETMGMKITKLKPVHGFSAETAAAFSILFSTFLGVPVSTTHTITGAIIGVGATTRLSAIPLGAGRAHRLGLDLHHPRLGPDRGAQLVRRFPAEFAKLIL